MGKEKKTGDVRDSKQAPAPAKPQFGDFLGPAISRSLTGEMPNPPGLDPDEHWKTTKRALLQHRLLKEAERQTSAAPPKSKEFTHSLDYGSVTVRGKTHALTSKQAQMIEILHNAYLDGKPDVNCHFILNELGTPNSRSQDTFRSNPEAKKALLKSGARRGMLRLAI